MGARSKTVGWLLVLASASAAATPCGDVAIETATLVTLSPQAAADRLREAIAGFETRVPEPVDGKLEPYMDATTGGGAVGKMLVAKNGGNPSRTVLDLTYLLGQLGKSYAFVTLEEGGAFRTHLAGSHYVAGGDFKFPTHSAGEVALVREGDRLVLMVTNQSGMWQPPPGSLRPFLRSIPADLLGAVGAIRYRFWNSASGSTSEPVQIWP